MRHQSARRILNTLTKQNARDWYRIDNRADEDAADIYLFDEIGFWGTTAKGFIDELAQIETSKINLFVASIGGDVFDGIAIYNALRTHDARVVAQVDSMAASIASVIVQAGDERHMVTASQMMIHRASAIAWGDADEMRDMADVLDKQDAIIADIYAERSGRKASHFADLMAAETWMNATETVEEGLADTVVKPAVSSSTDPDPDPDPDPDDDSTVEDSALAAFLASTEITLETT